MMQGELKKLVRITPNDENFTDVIETLFNWESQEVHRHYYTCRPVNKLPDRQIYYNHIQSRLQDGQLQIYLFTENKQVIGKVMMFDYNPRNQSAEFGYYLPFQRRGQGLGTLMVDLFIKEVFSYYLDLNKIYATTASTNESSIKLLERLGFKLDGRLREHYWLDGQRFDQLNYSLLRDEWKMAE